MLVALVAGYTRRISGEADRQQSLALDRLGRLADANTLLFSLHRVAQTLPASLDLDEALDSTMRRLRDLFDYAVAAVLLYEETDHGWVTARQEGIRLPARLTSSELPRRRPGHRRARNDLRAQPALEPDVAPIQQTVMAAMEKRLVDTIASTDAQQLMDQWLPMGVQGLEQWQSMWGQLAQTAAGFPRSARKPKE